MQKNSAFGKNNFDRLEAAGLVAGDDTTALVKAKTQTRITELEALAAKVTKVEAALTDLYVLSKPARLKRITQVMTAVKKLHASPLPVGAKKHIGNCLNELTSLREGIYASNAQVDKKALALIATVQAKEDIKALAAAATTRLDKIMADSTHDSDLEEFYRKAADVIEKHTTESAKLSAIQSKPFVIARVPVVPADGMLSVDKLTRLGFDVENLSGYAVLNKQLTIGINPRALLGEHGGAIKGEKAATAIQAEADRLRKLLQKKTNTKLQFVCDKAFTYDTGTWFWLMTNKELDALAKAFPGQHVKITRWGFAFNKPQSDRRPNRNKVST